MLDEYLKTAVKASAASLRGLNAKKVRAVSQARTFKFTKAAHRAIHRGAARIRQGERVLALDKPAGLL